MKKNDRKNERLLKFTELLEKAEEFCNNDENDGDVLELTSITFDFRDGFGYQKDYICLVFTGERYMLGYDFDLQYHMFIDRNDVKLLDRLMQKGFKFLLDAAEEASDANSEMWPCKDADIYFKGVVKCDSKGRIFLESETFQDYISEDTFLGGSLFYLEPEKDEIELIHKWDVDGGWYINKDYKDYYESYYYGSEDEDEDECGMSM